MRSNTAGYKVMTSSEAIRRLGDAEPIARMLFLEESDMSRKALANELFYLINDNRAVLTGELTPMASLAHNTITRRGRWEDPAQTAFDIAQEAAIKLMAKGRKWPADLCFKALAARILTCSSLDTIKRNYKHFRRRANLSGGSFSLDPLDPLASAIDPGIVPEHAYESLYSRVLAFVETMPSLERSVARKRILDLETMTGREFAKSNEISPAWASYQLKSVRRNMELYIFAIEHGICM